jgi:hypothetical protein
MHPRAVSGLAIVFLLTVGASAQTKSTSVSGRVIDSETKSGLRKAYLRLSSHPNTYTAVSDESGKFSFDAVEPGTYTLEAEHQGYIDGSYEESDGQSVQIKVDSGQSVKGVDIRLTPQGTISGLVVNEEGDLWVHAYVNLYRSEWVSGHRKLRVADGNGVNDLGEFRFGQLPPGKYYVVVEPEAYWEKTHKSNSEVSTRQRTWYPSAVDAANAAPIVLSPGGQVSNLEIRIQRGSAHRIRGTLVGLRDIPSDQLLGPFGGRGIAARPVSDTLGDGKEGTIRPNGSFEIEGLSPGAYEIRVSQGFPRLVLGKTKVQMDSRDIDDLVIQLAAPRPLKGKIQVAEEGSPIKVDGLWVRLATEGGPPLSAIAAADGSFEFSQVGLDQYEPYMDETASKGYYLRQIRYGDVVSINGMISTSASGGELMVVLSTRPARVTGRVKGDAEHPQVVLISNAGKMRVATFDQTRQFLFQDLPPGSYKLYAFDGAPGGAWADPDFMKEVGSSALELDLSEGDAKSVEISVFPKAELVRIVKKLGME